MLFRIFGKKLWTNICKRIYRGNSSHGNKRIDYCAPLPVPQNGWIKGYVWLIKYTLFSYINHMNIWTSGAKPVIIYSRHTLSDTFSHTDTRFQRKWKVSKFKQFFLVNYRRFPTLFLTKSLNLYLSFICT